MVGFEKIFVEDFEGGGEEANGLGPRDGIAALFLFLSRIGTAVVGEAWGNPQLDRGRPVSDGIAAGSGIFNS